MNLEEQVLQAQTDSKLRNAIIEQYMAFVLSCAAKTLGRSVTQNDDACSVAMIGFNEAITKYDAGKGPFLPFAALVIRNKLTDHLRKEYRHSTVIPMSSLSSEDESGREVPFEIADRNTEVTDAALEIQSVQQELSAFGISFFDLPKATPKSKKTKSACMLVIRFLNSNPGMVQTILDKKVLPSKLIMERTGVNVKLLERHRKYIIAGLIITSGGYDVLDEYFWGGRRETHAGNHY